MKSQDFIKCNNCGAFINDDENLCSHCICPKAGLYLTSTLVKVGTTIFVIGVTVYISCSVLIDILYK